MDIAPQLANSDGPEHNLRGFFVIGPQCVNPSDLLMRLMKFMHCLNAAPDLREARRAQRIQQGRSAAMRRGQNWRHPRPWEC